MSSERPETGAVLQGRYEIVGVVGRGGMGTVYRARDTRLDCTVAVKEMNENVARGQQRDDAVAQFEREARLLAQLSHPNLPRVTDYFVEEDRWYLILEYIDGVTLEELWRQRGCAALPMSDVVAWGVQVADVLAYLHSQRPPVVFRDVKPANIMLQSDGLVRLIDFGIARRFQEGAERDTLHYGSPGYSPPEQYGRTQTDPRSDIYALGATLHHLLTGVDPARTPFRFAALRSLVPDAPPSLEHLLRRCVTVDLAERCQSADEVRDGLVQVRAALAAADPRRDAAAASGPLPEVGPRIVSARLASAERRYAARRFARRSVAAAAAIVVVGAVAFAVRGRLLHSAGHAHATNGPAVVLAPPQAPPSTSQDAAAVATTLRITSSPSGAEVTLDDVDVGATPFETDQVDPGTHRVTITPSQDSGLQPWSRDITVARGQTVVLDVPLDAPGSMAPAPASQAAATVVQVSDRIASSRAHVAGGAAMRGVLISAKCRVTGALDRAGAVGVFFYGSDGVTPLRPTIAGTHYQNSAGQLSSAVSFVAMTDPADIPVEVFVPGPLFGTAYTGVFYRVVVFVDGRQVGCGDLRQLSR